LALAAYRFRSFRTHASRSGHPAGVVDTGGRLPDAFGGRKIRPNSASVGASP
jgi:hypothetical protein